MKLNKLFNHLKDEKIIYKKWEKLGIFKPNKSDKSYCIMMPPPNVTGSLHMGHALTFTIQDLLIRYYRLKGHEVLWQPGTDHAGIATQMVVEKKLLEEGILRKNLGRSEFIKKVWKWKKSSGNMINNQLRRLGSSADWSREKFTMDRDLSNSVRKVFIDLYYKGLIYKDKRLVNWDPKLLTAISDLEVEQKEQEGFLWHIKYIIDKKNYIVVATTRPETMFGDVAVAVNPNDKRYIKFIGKYCYIPISNKKIPIIGDLYADPTKGSGAVKITPAHDFNDFNVGKKNKLPIINIFNQNATLNNNVPKEFQKLDRFEARRKLLSKLNENNLLIKEEKQKMIIPYGDRSGVIIEPLLTDQWFCNAKKLAKEPINNVKNGKTKFFPKHWEKTFFQWMNNIEPWCISRQLWWGHQIPVWYGPDNKSFVAFSKKEAQELAKKHYLKKVNLIQDEDVLDTWFSSSLWPFSTLDWPKNNYFLNKFYPGNVLVTGFDIIFFWVARMMMMGSHFMKNTPFKDVYIHPLIKDEKGNKMSKSKGNIIDPLKLLDKFGADTLRFTLIALTTPTRDVKLSESKVISYRSFSTKIWNAAKFININQDKKYSKNFSINNIKFENIKLPINKWMIYELSIFIKNVEKNIIKYNFHEATNLIYHFIWHTYCDWYIEFCKIELQKKSKHSNELKNILLESFLILLCVIHPIMPFISEKLWSHFSNNKKMLASQKWPNLKTISNYKKDKNNINIIIKTISLIRNLRSDLNIPYKKNLILNISSKNNNIILLFKNYSNELSNTLKLSKINFNLKKVNKESAYLIFDKITLNIPLSGIVNINEELLKLNNNIDKLNNDLNKVNDKLKNKIFIKKAPKLVIENFHNQSKNIKSSIEKTKQIINSLK